MEETTLGSLLAKVAVARTSQDPGGGGSGGANSMMSGSPIETEQVMANLNLNLNLNISLNGSISEEEELRLLNFPPQREELATAIPLTAIFALLLVTGCVGNMCTAIVIARPKNKYMHTATNYYLFSLAMSDFLFLVLGLPQEMYTIWQRYPYAFGDHFCIIRGYLSEASTYASILTICAFTIERYVAICHPLWAHTMSQLPRAITSIVIIWMLAAVCAIPPAAELGIIMQQGPISNRTLERTAQCMQKRIIYGNMFAVSAVVFFIVPMIIVTVLYILIAIELRRSSKMNNAISNQSHQLQQHRHSNSHHHHNHNHNQVTCQHQYNPRCNQQKQHQQKGSQSQQQLVTSCRLSPSQSFAAGQGLHEAHQSNANNLMANIMSQRPSSALGIDSQQPQASAGSGWAFHLSQAKRQLSSCTLWAPLSSLGASEANRCQHCHHQYQKLDGGSQLMSSQSAINGQATSRMQANTNLALSLPSSANSAALPNAQHIQQGHHSPLSYHESLISRGGQHQAQQQQSRAAQETSVARCHHHQQHHQHHHSSGHRRSAAASSKKSVIRMLVAVVVSFFICWLPFHAQRLLASYLTKDENQNQFLLDIYLKLTYISGIMYYLSSTINPLLYQLMSAKFRLAFKETFKCSLFKCAMLKGQRRTSGCSPSNSLKGPNHGENHLSSCCTSQACQQKSPCADFGTACQLPDANNNNDNGYLNAPEHCHHYHHHQLGPPSYLNRIRGSLASLFVRGPQQQCCCPQPTSPPKLTLVSSDAAGSDATQGRHTMLKMLKTQSQRKRRSQLTAANKSTNANVEEEELEDEELEPLNKLIKPTRELEQEEDLMLDDEGCVADLNESSERNAHLLTLTSAESSSTAANSASSSPEQRLASNQVTQASSPSPRPTGTQVNKPELIASGSTSNSSGSSQAENGDGGEKQLGKPKSGARQRRRSLQHQLLAQVHSNHRLAAMSSHHQYHHHQQANSRRKSSSSSATKHLSSSLSSSERQLDKKMSLSTTTSAIDDCSGTSYTTTGSLSNPRLSHHTTATRDEKRNQLHRAPSSSDDDASVGGHIEDEPSTVIDICDLTTRDKDDEHHDLSSTGRP